MTKDTYKKILTLITYALILSLILLNIGNIGSFLWKIVKVLSPLWVGLFLACFLNVPMSALERKVFHSKSKKTRVLSILLSILIIVAIVVLLFVWVIPDLIDSISYLLKSTPGMINKTSKFFTKLLKDTNIGDYAGNLNVSSNLNSIFSGLMKSLLGNVSGILTNVSTILVNFITGLIIAVYFLYGKEDMLKKGRQVVTKLFDEKTIGKMDKFYSLSKKAFHDFIAYQCLECVILGTIMFIAFKIFRFPYAMTIAFLTAVTAIVPIFGATVSCIIGAILISTRSLTQALVFIIVYQVVQQIENNLIYPHVVGKHVGLPPILTILAIIVGGKIGGFFGIIICIPLTAVLNTLFWSEMKKDIPKITIKNAKKLIDRDDEKKEAEI